MANLTLRSVKGSPLTNDEMDANFNNLNIDIQTRATETFKTINAGGTNVVADSSSDTLTIIGGDGVLVSGNAAADSITIINTDKGSAQNIFKNVLVGSTNLAADSNNDTLNIEAGTGISLGANSATDTLTISLATTSTLITEDSTSNINRYVTFVDATSGYNQVKADTSLQYNPSTNILDTTVTSSINASLTSNTSNNTYPLVFTPSTISGKFGLLFSGNSTGRYNPSTNTATINISGNAATATTVIDNSISTNKIVDQSVTAAKLATNVNPIGRQTLWIPASAMSARQVGGAANLNVYQSSNSTQLNTLAFDSASIEYAQFTIRMPNSWDVGPITFVASWMANTTTTTGVSWGLRAKAIADGEATDATWGTPQFVTDYNVTTYRLNIAAESAPVTVNNAGSQKFVIFEIYRDVTNVNDTLAVDALLLGINIYYNTSAANDA